MLEPADIVKEYGDACRMKYGDRMPLSHWDALWDIEHCRTFLMGGELYWCAHCQEYLYSYHSCGNRHCPKSGGDRADAWRDRQMEKLLPGPYFLVTFTLLHTLNLVARSNQKLIYDLVFKASAEALKTLALNPTWLGGKIGMVGALHTRDRAMGYHVHVHYPVPAGGIDPACSVSCSMCCRNAFRKSAIAASCIRPPERPWPPFRSNWRRRPRHQTGFLSRSLRH